MGKIQNVIYILTNPQYPEYIKIGYASDLKARLSSLDTGTMSSFIPYAVYKTQLSVADKQLHRIIGLLNPKLRATKFKNGKKSEREFFKLDPEEAYELLKCIAKISGTLNCLYKIDANGKLIPDSECNQTIPGQSPAQKPQTIPPKPVPKNHAPIPDGIYHTKHKIKAAGISITATMEDISKTRRRYECLIHKNYGIDIFHKSRNLTHKYTLMRPQIFPNITGALRSAIRPDKTIWTASMSRKARCISRHMCLGTGMQ